MASNPAGFLSPISSKITVTKEKERRKRKERRRKGGEERKAMVVLFGFYNGYFEIVFGQKNCWTQKVHLVITFSKIRLDVY